MNAAVQQGQGHRHAPGTHPMRRAGIFLAVAFVLIVVAIAWATDGFTTIPHWDVKWVDDDYKEIQNTY
jgi:hypothetical protein